MELGKALNLSHLTMATASVYFQRFFMFQAFQDFPRYVIKALLPLTHMLNLHFVNNYFSQWPLAVYFLLESLRRHPKSAETLYASQDSLQITEYLKHLELTPKRK